MTIYRDMRQLTLEQEFAALRARLAESEAREQALRDRVTALGTKMRRQGDYGGWAWRDCHEIADALLAVLAAAQPATAACSDCYPDDPIHTYDCPKAARPDAGGEAQHA